ncbi:MAG: hypothetical protein J6N15_11920 [Ruminiclostridium sp.]|nr:hypothetical protein [Ruminiclostridium sp.]
MTKTNTVRSEFVLVITGSANNDTVAERVAAGVAGIVHHKLTYVPVYGEFDQIRKLQLKVRRSPYAMGRRICAAIDISEWIGHEEEDYFVAAVKYFHDHSDRMSYVFTAGEGKKTELKKMYVMLRTYMHGTMSIDETFMNVEALAKYIESRSAESDAAMLLAEVLMRDEMKSLRTYPVIKSICSDISELSSADKISVDDVKTYLSSENSLMYLINENLSLEYAKRTEKDTGKTGSSDAA